jgi:hypothetical protein
MKPHMPRELYAIAAFAARTAAALYTDARAPLLAL